MSSIGKRCDLVLNPSNIRSDSKKPLPNVELQKMFWKHTKKAKSEEYSADLVVV